ncbi:MAG: S41 family peptidase [Candidatus Daviesbacteria bacterium]|nr:S41 family peptidase [Candidatus Daviesbacteria bacterium]
MDPLITKKDSILKSFLKIPQTGLGYIAIILLIFILGYQIGQREISLNSFGVNSSSEVRTNMDFSLFWKVWDLVSQKYIDKKAIDPQKLYYGAIQGMVAAIGDPYTVFLPPESQKNTKEQLGGSFEGVGMQLGYNKDKRLVVIAPLKDTPAEKAGIKAGDLILSIDKKDVNNLSLPDAVNLIRGPKGTKVSLSIFSEGADKPRDVTLSRDTIIVKTVDLNMKTTPQGRGVAYIRLSGFGEKTDKEWAEAVTSALSNPPQGVIVDVRNNPGGYLESAVNIGSEFIGSGPIVLQENSVGQRQELVVTRQGRMLKIPLVILINKGSASASEILAGAMQDNKRARLVGEQSFGKGTIQSTEDLPQGTGIHITTAKWLTPSGRWIHGIGLTPDVAIEYKADEKDPLKDNQLEKALEVLDEQI